MPVPRFRIGKLTAGRHSAAVWVLVTRCANKSCDRWYQISKETWRVRYEGKQAVESCSWRWSDPRGSVSLSRSGTSDYAVTSVQPAPRAPFVAEREDRRWMRPF